MSEVPAAPPAPVVVVDDSGSPFGLTLTIGIGTVVFGVLVLSWPSVTARAFAILVGIWLLAAGAVRIVNAFRSGRGLGRQILSGIVGVLLFIAGAACLRDVAKGLLVLALIVALAWLLSGVAWWALAAGTTGAARGWLTAVAVVSIVVGLVFLFWPEFSLATLVVLTGVGAVLVGAAEIAFAVWSRRLRA